MEGEPKILVNSSAGRLENTSQNFRKVFLLAFTKELIRHSRVEEFFELKNVLEKKQPEKPKTKEVTAENFLSIMHAEEPKRKTIRQLQPPQRYTLPPMQAPTPRLQIQQPRPIIIRSLPIPDHPLPQPVRHIQPAPSSVELDLGKLNTLLSNPSIMSIETNGPDEAVIAKGASGAITTNITLSKEEIDQTLQAFSEASRIPLHEGVAKIAVGKLILSAIISEVIGSKFIIKKITQQRAIPQQGIFPGTVRRY
ncbi:MAG: hypothetical protein KKB31_01275 [Nanoarchaeota archaeon]|nr:hypothetical protein [Nanoarchaeota archaeon]